MTEAQWDLVLSEVHTLRACAKRVARRVPARVSLDFDEFYDAGLAALISCAERYDPAIGAPYGAYARRRVLGAMVSLLRSRWTRADSLDVPPDDAVIQGLIESCGHPETAAERLPDPGPLPDKIAERRIEAERVQRAIAGLPARQRWILLAWSDGATLQAIGERHAKSTAWAHGQVRLALEALRRRLAPADEEGRRAA